MFPRIHFSVMFSSHLFPFKFHLGKAFFTRPVRTVSRRSNTFWSSGQSVKCRCTTLVKNSIISMRSMECPRTFQTLLGEQKLGSRQALCTTLSSFAVLFAASNLRRKNHFNYSAGEEGRNTLNWKQWRKDFFGVGGGGWGVDGEEEMSWEGLILALQYTVLL